MNTFSNKDRNPFLVTGATGNVGRHLVNKLIQKGHRVRALTRTPSKANFSDQIEVIAGDLNKPGTLIPAPKGVTGVHLITTIGDSFEPLQTGPEIIKIAEKAEVQRVTVLWSGFEGPVEQAVKASSLEWTILQAQEFMSNTLEWKESIGNENIAREVFGDRKTAYIHPADIASVAVAALTESGNHEKEVVLTGPEVLTPKRAVEIMADVLGRDIRFEERSEAEERRRMKEEYRLNQDVIDYVISWKKNPPKEAYTVSPLMEEITGRLPRTFRQWVVENQHHFNDLKH